MIAYLHDVDVVRPVRVPAGVDGVEGGLPVSVDGLESAKGQAGAGVGVGRGDGDLQPRDGRAVF